MDAGQNTPIETRSAGPEIFQPVNGRQAPGRIAEDENLAEDLRPRSERLQGIP